MRHAAVVLAASSALALACARPGPAPVAAPPPVAAAPVPAAPSPSAPAPVAAPASAPPVGLRLEGTPDIPDALRVRLDRYLNTRSAVVADISDDGKQLLVATRFGDSNQIHLVRTPGGARVQLTFNREPATSASFVPGSPRSITFGHDLGGNEQYQLFRLDLDAYRTGRLTDGKSRNTDPVWSLDGKRVAWASNARNGVDFDIWVSDGVGASPAQLVVEGKGQWTPVGFSADGKQLLLSEYVSITRSRMHLCELATSTVRALTPETPAAAYRDGVLAPDGKRAYLTSDRDGEFVHVYEVDLKSGAFRPLTADVKWNVDTIALSGDGKTLAFVVNQGGYGKLHLLDTRTRKARPVAAIPEGMVSQVVFARKAPVLAFTLLGPTRTGDAYTYDLRSGKVTRWTESEMGGLDPSRLIAPTLIEVTSFDGTKVPAFYYRPAGDGPFPVVIQIHGGPEAQARPYFNPFIQLLASESAVAVLEPNVRGSDGYGKSYLALDDGKKREDSVKDIGALLDWVATQKDLDKERVAVAGGSYGGYMVLASLTHFGQRIRAGIDVVGISHFVTFLENTSGYRRDLRRVEYGDERDPAMRTFLDSISPLTNVGKIKSALFVAQGANDPRVPASEAEQIVKAVRSAGHDVWYMLAPDEGHGFAKKSNRDVYTLLALLFLEKHLQR